MSNNKGEINIIEERINEYLENIFRFNNLAKGYVPVFKELTKRITLTENGQVIYINAGMKQEISKSLNCSMGHIGNCIADLNKNNIFQKQSSGTYMLNPNLFGVNREWKDFNNIESIDLNIIITSKGKEMNATFIMKK